MPFIYCKNGFDFDKIQIILYDAPIYTSSDEEMDFVPVKTSENKTAFISKKDFLNWKKPRVKVLLNNDDNIFDYFYINFDDIHNIKFHLFVYETLLLHLSLANTYFNKVLDFIVFKYSLFMKPVKNIWKNSKIPI